MFRYTGFCHLRGCDAYMDETLEVLVQCRDGSVHGGAADEEDPSHDGGPGGDSGTYFCLSNKIFFIQTIRF